jgi:hypothetical protein
MKKIEMRRDTYTDSDYGMTVPFGFAVLDESNRQGGKLYYACDKICDRSGNIIVPLDEHFHSLEDIARLAGETYYISEDEMFRHSHYQNQ